MRHVFATDWARNDIICQNIETSKVWLESSHQTQMLKYNIAPAYSALKPPCLNSDRIGKQKFWSESENKSIQPKRFPWKNIVRQGYQTTIGSTLYSVHGHGLLKCSTFILFKIRTQTNSFWGKLLPPFNKSQFNECFSLEIKSYENAHCKTVSPNNWKCHWNYPDYQKAW